MANKKKKKKKKYLKRAMTALRSVNSSLWRTAFYALSSACLGYLALVVISDHLIALGVSLVCGGMSLKTVEWYRIYAEDRRYDAPYY